MPIPKILVVDDIAALHYSYQRRLGDQIRYFGSHTIDEARLVFQANPDLAIIAMDACLTGKTPDTLDLVREFRRTFSGPMVAISGDPEFRRQLVEAGCDYECDKVELPALVGIILETLGT